MARNRRLLRSARTAGLPARRSAPTRWRMGAGSQVPGARACADWGLGIGLSGAGARATRWGWAQGVRGAGCTEPGGGRRSLARCRNIAALFRALAQQLVKQPRLLLRLRRIPAMFPIGPHRTGQACTGAWPRAGAAVHPAAPVVHSWSLARCALARLGTASGCRCWDLRLDYRFSTILAALHGVHCSPFALSPTPGSRPFAVTAPTTASPPLCT